MGKHIRLLISRKTKTLELILFDSQENGFLVEDIDTMTAIDLDGKQRSETFDFREPNDS